MDTRAIDTLERAKRELRQNWENGCVCPCCGQDVKLYPRKISTSCAIALVKLGKLSVSTGQSFIHVDDLGVSKTGGEFAQLRHWGIIAMQVNAETGKRCSGMWMLTDTGFAFIRNQVSVPRICYTYNKRPRKFSEEQTTIMAAFKDRFDYAEMMGFLL